MRVKVLDEAFVLRAKLQSEDQFLVRNFSFLHEGKTGITVRSEKERS